jgi:hypothetical protein
MVPLNRPLSTLLFMLWLMSYLRGALKIKYAYNLVLSLSSGFSRSGLALAVHGAGQRVSRVPAQATLVDTALSLMSFLRYRCV